MGTGNKLDTPMGSNSDTLMAGVKDTAAGVTLAILKATTTGTIAATIGAVKQLRVLRRERMTAAGRNGIFSSSSRTSGIMSEGHGTQVQAVGQAGYPAGDRVRGPKASRDREG